MTPDQISLIKLTFVCVLDIKEQAGRMFYDRLFEIAPDTRPMFKADIGEQAGKLMDSLAVAISTLRDGPALATMLDGLGQRHARYGVKDEHYEKVGQALIWTLEKGLGEAFTPEARKAWTALYATVATRMKAAVAKRAAVA